MVGHILKIDAFGDKVFQPDVDRAFTVKNIKRGAKPQYS